ncbi:hypothetical protein FSP39_014595 [Pinctada imbricata]|uniref:Proton-coupled folate transporter n=1 Tax=Pinctada imbricata TaxID=66713 RepID=A0AA88YDL0_PINIB|nr:hypothetical protein FSP39_014595 [Pinctada imbricata]
MVESDCCLEMKIEKGSERKEVTSTPTKEDESEPRKKLTLFFICGTLLFCHFFAQGLRENALNQYSYKEFQSMVEQDVSGNASMADAYNGSDISVSCVKSSNSTLYEGQSEAQRLTSQWNIYRTVIPGAASILTTLLFGVLSDTYGRKWFITIPLIGHFVRNALYTIGIYFRIDIYIFLAIGMTEFLFGPGEAILAAIFSTVADNTSADKNRSKVLAIMILSAGVGLSTSLVSSGYIIDSAGYMYPMLISSAILLPAIILSFCLSDSSGNRTVSSADNKDTFSKKIIKQLKGIYEFYVKDSSVSGNRWKYIVCMLAFLLTQIVNGGVVNVEFLFTFNTPLCWNSIIFGWYGLAQSVTLNIVSMAFFPLIQKCLRDETINVIASISSAVSLIFEAFAINDIMMFIGNYFEYIR